MASSVTTILHPDIPFFQMPHVFVHPPEEEQVDNPPWCEFDADRASDDEEFPSRPNIHFFDDPQDLLPNTHTYTAGPSSRHSYAFEADSQPVMSKRSRTYSTAEVSRFSSDEVDVLTRSGVGEDSDIIEVIKVKRRDAGDGSDYGTGGRIKRSDTIKARASKAFKSIKNVGKRSQRKPHVKELWTSTESMPGFYKGLQQQMQQQKEQVPPSSLPARQPALSRRNTRSLSRLFQPSPPPPDFRVSDCPERPSQSASIPASETESSLPYLKSSDTASSVNECLSPTDSDTVMERPVSPSPSTKKSRKRFSLLELHRLFSFSPSSPDDPQPISPTISTMNSVPSSNPSFPSTPVSLSSSHCPDVPLEEVYAAVQFYDPVEAEDEPVSKPARVHWRQTLSEDDGEIVTPSRELNFEMRLDSLHFDSISFDPDNFDISTS